MKGGSSKVQDLEADTVRPPRANFRKIPKTFFSHRGRGGGEEQ
jgi:hypothetical protein